MIISNLLNALAAPPATKSRPAGRQFAVTFTSASDLEKLTRLLNHQVIQVLSGHPAPTGFNLYDLMRLSQLLPEEPGNLVASIETITCLAKYIQLQLRQQRLQVPRLHPAIDAHKMGDALERLLAGVSQPMLIAFRIG